MQQIKNFLNSNSFQLNHGFRCINKNKNPIQFIFQFIEGSTQERNLLDALNANYASPLEVTLGAISKLSLAINPGNVKIAIKGTLHYWQALDHESCKLELITVIRKKSLSSWNKFAFGRNIWPRLKANAMRLKISTYYIFIWDI
jgi:hypothetical protein